MRQRLACVALLGLVAVTASCGRSGIKEVVDPDGGPPSDGPEAHSSEVRPDVSGVEPEAGPTGCIDGWCWEYPRAPRAVAAVWASGPGDAWAVGPTGPFTIFRWNGTSWKEAATTKSLIDVWGSGSDDVWAVGEAPVMHWDGKTWSPVEAPAKGLSAVWGSGPNDVWAVGSKVILHWDGLGWSVTPVEGNASLIDVWGSRPNDVWAVGGRETVLHWDGERWSRVVTGKVPTGMIVTFAHVWASGAGDVWITGTISNPNTFEVPRFIGLRWDGTAWSDFENPSRTDDISGIWGTGPDDVWLTGQGGTYRWKDGNWSAVGAGIRSQHVWGRSTDDVWLCEGSNVHHWDGKQIVKSPMPQATFDDLIDISGKAPNNLWALAQGGKVLRRDNGVWSAVGGAGVAFGRRFGGVWATGPDDLWVVGEGDASGGAIFHWDGASWSRHESIAVPALYDVWGSGPDDVWATGYDGTIVHWDGKAWSRSSSNTTSALVRIWGSDSSNIWVVSYDGMILYWNGVKWTSWSTGIRASLTAVTGSDSKNVWAVNALGTLFHWNGSTWTTTHEARITGSPRSLWSGGPNDLWVVDQGAVHHWQGSEWSTFFATPTPAAPAYQGLGIWGHDSSVWLVGVSGTIRRYSPTP